MKRRMGLLAILLPLLLLVPLLPAALLPAAAAVAAMDAVRLTASADYDRASQAVRISGNVSSGKGSWISVQLLNEVGNPVYFDQIDAGERGDFALLLPIPEPDGGRRVRPGLGDEAGRSGRPIARAQA
ncbi:MAG: hypothetical protein K0Q94_6843 [Paenibacillus sp.]|nr:hypothetical protein [Paenibacillus sp.]